MTSNTLDELGRATLEAVAGGRETPEAIAEALEAPREAIDDRLARLVDNALVREGGGEYELTENGQRVLAATPIGVYDDRIDTPDRVERAIAGFSLRPDEAAALRSAFSFLRYWSDATTAEIVDAAYSEAPAGYDDPDRWWDECIAERLADLPDVRFDPDESVSGVWTYEGEAVIEAPDEMDGREVGEEGSTPSSFGSVRHGIERLTTTADERAAARTAFAVLFDRKRASADALVERVYDDHRAGFDSPTEWTEWLAGVFDALPGIERESGGDDPAWRYDPSAGLEPA